MEKPLIRYSGYAIKTPLFEGPLDLLSELVRNYEINIYDIPIAMITEQFLNYIRFLKQLDLTVASEFIVMVAHLLLIKSRMLLPIESDLDEEEDPRSELVEQLLEYQRFKEAAHLLEEAEMMSQHLLDRKSNQMTFDFPDDRDNWVDVKLFDLVNAFSRLLSRGQKAEPVFPVLDEVDEAYDPEQRITEIRTLLEVKGRAQFEEILSEDAARGEIIITFLAILHMIKRGTIVVKQHRLFGDITVFLRQEQPGTDSEEGIV